MKHFKILLAVMLFIVQLSCTKEDKNIVPTIRPQKLELRQRSDQNSLFGQNYVVPLEVATKIAKRVNLNLNDNKTIQDGAHEIQNYYIVKDSQNLPVLYIFNFIPNGMTVISADERHEPICAVVPKGKFEEQEVPSGLINWYEVTIQNIGLLRSGSVDNTARAKSAWKDILSSVDNDFKILSNNCCEECPNYPDCLDLYELGCGDPYVDCGDPCGSWQTTQIGPLMSTTWNQGCSYNEQCPDKNCTNVCWSNENAWTGCVATAIAQVLRYWAHPSTQNYNYSTMPNSFGNSEVQRMMRDVGNAVDMDYQCSGSGANSNKTPGAFKNTFGYSSANRSSYGSGSYQTVITNINASKPVILDGCRTRTNRFLGLIYTYSNCHAWVCDGYRRTVNNCFGYLHFHMNWGWGGSGNGWYAFNNWSSPNGTYQYAQDFCHNINP